MLKYFLKRILAVIPMTIGITFIVFMLISITPADPGRIMLGLSASQEQVDEINHELGYDRNPLVRYGMFLGNAVRGDFGKSYYTNRPVIEEISTRFGTTVKLTMLSLLLAVLYGVPVGVLCAIKQNTLTDNICSALAILTAAMPAFWLSLIMLMLFAHTLGWFPVGGIVDGWRSWVLPVLTLGVPYGSGFVRFVRSTMLETIRSDYVRTARAKGAKEKTVIWSHAFRNALMPVVTIIGLDVGYLMGGAIIIEQVFALPGLGMLILEAVKRKDVPQVLGSVMVFAVLFLLILLVVDLLYTAVDPRIRSLYGPLRKRKRKGAGVLES